MSITQLERLEKNPYYNLSDKQKAMLEKYRIKKFKNNPNFIKHDTNLVPENASERTDGKAKNRN